MAKYRHNLTDEQRAQLRAEQRQLVRASVEQLRSSDGWWAYLSARARFASFSVYLGAAASSRVMLAGCCRRHVTVDDRGYPLPW